MRHTYTHHSTMMNGDGDWIIVLLLVLVVLVGAVLVVLWRRSAPRGAGEGPAAPGTGPSSVPPAPPGL
jgi:hypothetical protein